MGKIIRSFRAKMLFLFGVSILLSGGIIFLLYKLLQMYYHTMKYEHPLNSVRYFIRDIGDVNFFYLFSHRLLFCFSSCLRSGMQRTLTKFPMGLTSLPTEISQVQYISIPMMNSGLLQKTLTWPRLSCSRRWREETLLRTARINWS